MQVVGVQGEPDEAAAGGVAAGQGFQHGGAEALGPAAAGAVREGEAAVTVAGA